jgi:outer membrane protein
MRDQSLIATEARTVRLLGLSLIIALLSLVVAAEGRAQAATPLRQLTLAAAIETALANNPTFLQQSNDVGVGRSAVRSAYGSWMPSANASAGVGYTAPGELRYESQGLGNQPETYSSNFRLGVSYQVSGATLLQPSLEKARLEATQRRVSGAEAQLATEVTRQYLLVLQARERLTQADREVARTVEHVRLAEGRLQVGSGTPLDVRRAEVQEAQADVRRVQAENTAAIEILRLSQLLGAPLAPDAQLEADFEIFEPAWTPEDLLSVAVRNNPTLLAARANAEAAGVSIRSARSAYLPSLNMSVGVVGSVFQTGNIDPLVRQQMTQLQSGFGSCQNQNEIRTRVGLPAATCIDPNVPGFETMLREQISARNDGFPFGYEKQPIQASIGLSLPIFTGLNRQHQVEIARASATDARYQIRVEELRLEQEVTGGLLGLKAAYRTALLQERVRERAEEELRLATERFRFGAASSIEVTDAQTNLAQAEIDKIEAIFNFHQSMTALEALLGEGMRQP